MRACTTTCGAAGNLGGNLQRGGAVPESIAEPRAVAGREGLATQGVETDAATKLHNIYTKEFCVPYPRPSTPCGTRSRPVPVEAMIDGVPACGKMRAGILQAPASYMRFNIIYFYINS